MTNQTGAPNAAAAVVTDAVGPAKAAGGRRRKVQQYDKVRGARWWRELGWRHVVGVLAVLFALFPILFVVSASLNPLGTLASTELLPTAISFDNYTQPHRRRARPVHHLVRQHPDGVRRRLRLGQVFFLARRVRVLPVPVHRPAGSGC